MHRMGAGAEAILQAQKLKNKLHIQVLLTLSDYPNAYPTFTMIAEQINLPRRQVRRIIRLLARKGLAEHCVGLFNSYGEIAGSGYDITIIGKAVAGILEDENDRSRQRTTD